MFLYPRLGALLEGTLVGGTENVNGCTRSSVDLQVVNLYLSCLPQSQHALVLERLRDAMPNNMELGLRYTLAHRH